MARISSDERDGRLSDFMHARPRLFGVAYRILRSAAEAEDLVQDVWLRWQKVDHSHVVNASALLAVITTRLAINRARSMSSRLEALERPSPVELVDTSAGPGTRAEQAEALALAITLVLEKLSARERAAYVLREAFNYSYPHIAALLGVSEVSSRQLVTRARRHVIERRRAPVSRCEQQRLFAAFLSAAQTGEVSALEGLFAAETLAS